MQLFSESIASPTGLLGIQGRPEPPIRRPTPMGPLPLLDTSAGSLLVAYNILLTRTCSLALLAH